MAKKRRQKDEKKADDLVKESVRQAGSIQKLPGGKAAMRGQIVQNSWGVSIRCHECVYKRKIAKTEKIECVYNWALGISTKSVNMIPLGMKHGVQNGFYYFPIFYEPVWMALGCGAFSTVLNENFDITLKPQDKFLNQMYTLDQVMRYVIEDKTEVKKDESEGDGEETTGDAEEGRTEEDSSPQKTEES